MTCQAQWQWGVDFDSSQWIDRVSIDTITYPNNTWEIGNPEKVVFSSAFSAPNAIVTDVQQPVPPNDTSAFYLYHVQPASAPFHVFSLKFQFQLDGDSTDYGKVEVSPDGGINWVDVLLEDSIYDLDWHAPKPTLSGSTNGWQAFNLSLYHWASGFGNFPIEMTADTIIFRFTYITDDGSNTHDGWIIDDFQLLDVWEGIEEYQSISSTVYPNPSVGHCIMEFENPKSNQFVLHIIDANGKLMLKQNVLTNKIELNTGDFRDGSYFYRLVDIQGRQKSNGNFTVIGQ